MRNRGIKYEEFLKIVDDHLRLKEESRIIRLFFMASVLILIAFMVVYLFINDFDIDHEKFSRLMLTATGISSSSILTWLFSDLKEEQADRRKKEVMDLIKTREFMTLKKRISSVEVRKLITDWTKSATE